MGFGLGRDSNMKAADIIVGGVHPNGSAYLTNRHIISQQNSFLDQEHNWVLNLAQENNNHTFLSFSRTFDNCDQNDVPVTKDALVLIWAFGEKDNEDGE